MLKPRHEGLEEITRVCYFIGQSYSKQLMCYKINTLWKNLAQHK